jgi:hypothetical protein
MPQLSIGVMGGSGLDGFRGFENLHRQNSFQVEMGWAKEKRPGIAPRALVMDDFFSWSWFHSG